MSVRDDLEARLKRTVDQLPCGLLQRLCLDAEEFLSWYHSKRQSRRGWRGKKKRGWSRFE